jgi:hypothetical protein
VVCVCACVRVLVCGTAAGRCKNPGEFWVPLMEKAYAKLIGTCRTRHNTPQHVTSRQQEIFRLPKCFSRGCARLLLIGVLSTVGSYQAMEGGIESDMLVDLTVSRAKQSIA